MSLAFPPPSHLQAILCRITEVLARELTNSSEQAPVWSEFEWTVARAVAAMHGVSPLLSRSLRWRGPPAWSQFLTEQRIHTANRQRRMQALLSQIDEEARGTGIALMTLKGAALHKRGLYEIGDRPMADIDLLVRPSDAARASALFVELGFALSSENWHERIFAPVGGLTHARSGEHSDNSLKIELHERICERLPLRITDASDSIFPLNPHPGLNDYDSNAALMLHLQLHDLALLSERMSDADWDKVLSSRPSGRRLWWAYPPLEMTARYYRSSVPPRVLAAIAADCPYFLRKMAARRTLYEVSYSYLWVRAFPGIEWCQSILELLAYVASRIKPDAKHLQLREYVAATQAYGNQGGWAHLSQTRRILRWIVSRQTRPLTMHAISAELAQSQ